MIFKARKGLIPLTGGLGHELETFGPSTVLRASFTVLSIHGASENLQGVASAFTRQPSMGKGSSWRGLLSNALSVRHSKGTKTGPSGSQGEYLPLPQALPTAECSSKGQKSHYLQKLQKNDEDPAASPTPGDIATDWKARSPRA